MMSVTNRLGLTTAEYLKARPPSLGSIQTGLSIFALFVIIRYCVQRTYSWLRPAQRLNSAPYHHHHRRHHTTNNDLVLPIYQPHPWPMDEKSSQGIHPGGLDHQGHNIAQDDGATAIPMEVPWRSSASESMPRHFIPRPPPAPPLTPPELSNAVFALDERRLSDHESLIHQPNPADYLSSTSTSSFQVDGSIESFIPRRRSYTKTLPMGGPMRQAPLLSTDAGSGDQTLSAISAAGSMRLLPANPAAEEDVAAAASFSSTSTTTCSTSPSVAASATAASSHKAQRNVDVQGEIISVLDREGAGWTRHTRVYGGGACLACAASGGGGFYGATVTPEEMR